MIFDASHGGSFAEEAVEYVMIYVDPILTVYYIIAIALFAIFSYKKPELRFFIITFLCILMSVIMMLSHAYEAEAIFLFIAGASSIFAILYYRYKVGLTTIAEVDSSG
jgi:hypothetical protein